MTQPRSPHEGPGSRSVVPWLALAACLVVAAGFAVWLLSIRDPMGSTEAAGATTTAPTTADPSDRVGALDAPVAGTLTAEALLTPADVADAGLTVGTPGASDAPAFPVLCDAPDWGTQWSAPEQGVGQEYPGQGAVVSEYAAGYADATAASAALARLTGDAASCPDLSTGGSVESTGPATVGGDESAVFVVDDGGHDGVIGVTWSVVVRSGDTLLLVGYTTEQQIGTGSGPVGEGDDSSGDSAGARSTAEALASAALDRFTTSN
ncbi:MAG: hypothetical protein JWR41_1248 [Modestobacter sp.]|nr:hypothetical protein [Modestobacter sp.]